MVLLVCPLYGTRLEPERPPDHLSVEDHLSVKDYLSVEDYLSEQTITEHRLSREDRLSDEYGWVPCASCAAGVTVEWLSHNQSFLASCVSRIARIRSMQVPGDRPGPQTRLTGAGNEEDEKGHHDDAFR